MPREKRYPAVAKAIRVANEQLGKMPDSPEVRSIQGDIRMVEAEVDGWTVTPPVGLQREGIMQKVMAIHVAITRLVRVNR